MDDFTFAKHRCLFHLSSLRCILSIRQGGKGCNLKTMNPPPAAQSLGGETHILHKKYNYFV